MSASLLGTLLAVGYVGTLLLIPAVLLTKHKHPVSTVAWVLAILFLPFIGPLGFLIFGINRVQRRAQAKRVATLTVGRSLSSRRRPAAVAEAHLSEKQQCLMRLTSRITQFEPTFGNSIKLLIDTKQAFAEIEQAIREAKESIHFEYYIYRSDRAGTRLRDLLIEKARQGVAVRFLYDWIGSLFLTRRFLRPMIDAGIQVAPFLPGRTFRERWSVNLCNHRKIVITDGRIGFTGGVNVGDEYLGRDPYYGDWRDTHMRIVGPAVPQLQQIFAEDWFYATGQELDQERLFPPPPELANLAAQVVAGSPQGDIDIFYALFFAAINEAHEQVTLATSYFVPPSGLLTALQVAGYRGVRVRLMVAGPPTYRTTLYAGRSYYDFLLAAGVEIYEYERCLFHTKTLTIDGCWSLVGTPNFDFRSVYLNFEDAVAIYDCDIARELAEHFENDLQHCRRIDPDTWKHRSKWEVLTENTCRLFAPVL